MTLRVLFSLKMKRNDLEHLFNSLFFFSLTCLLGIHTHVYIYKVYLFLSLQFIPIIFVCLFATEEKQLHQAISAQTQEN